MEKLDCCVQGQGLSKVSKWMTVCPDDTFWITEPLTTKLGMVMHHHEPTCLPKRLIGFLKVKVTVKAHVMKIWLSNMSSGLLILLQLNLVWWHSIISFIVFWKDWIALLWSRTRSQKRLRIPANVLLGDISSTAEPSVTKLVILLCKVTTLVFAWSEWDVIFFSTFFSF